MDLVRQSSLQPLLFAHHGALVDVDQEVARIRRMEQGRRSPGNFVLFLGRGTRGAAPDADDSRFLINPCLAGAVGPLSFGSIDCPPRLGHENPPLDAAARRFLGRFRHPVPAGSLNPAERKQAERYCQALFLLRLRHDAPVPA